MKSSKLARNSHQRTNKDDDFVRIHHNGKEYVLPRSEYHKPLTQEDHARATPNRSSMQKPTSEENRNDKTQQTAATVEEDPKIEHIFSLTDMIESKETIIEQPIRKLRPMESKVSFEDFPKPEPHKSTDTLAARSAASLDSRKCLEATEKLCQLKSTVVDLIDQTIGQFELEEQFGQAAALHPSGDGSKQMARVLNSQVLKTDSFVQNRREIKRKLYTEIEQLIGRLKDMDLLESKS